MKYLSEKLSNKVFNSIEELEQAEAEYDKAQKEKEEASLARKNEASKVEEAWKAFNAAKKVYNEKVSAAKKVYLEEVAKASEKVNAVIKEESEALEKVEDVYDEALAEFNKNHPDGYRLRLKDGDNVKVISRSGDFDFIDDFFNSFFRRF